MHGESLKELDIGGEKYCADPPPQSGSSLGRRAAWLLFCITTVHLAFVFPSVSVIPGERVNLLSGVVCGLSLTLTILCSKSNGDGFRLPETFVSVILSALVILSSHFSLVPECSSARGFVVLNSSLGGFWCARLLLDSPRRQRLFMWLCVFLVIGIDMLSLWGSVFGKNFYSLVDTHWHPLVGRLILLSFAPMALLYQRSLPVVITGIFVLCLSYGVLLLGGGIGVESAVGIPIGMCLLAALFREWRTREFTAILAALFVLAAFFGAHLLHHRKNFEKTHISVAYRIENIFFSPWVASHHPFLGIGLTAPRTDLLDSYETRYPHIGKEDFALWNRELRTSENMFLTFTADLGFPFVIVYSGALAILLFALLRRVLHPPEGLVFHPLVLFLPLMGGLAHFQVFDGILHPQVSWFFHILLGLIPVSTPPAAKSTFSKTGLIVRLGGFTTALVMGLGVGLAFVYVFG